MSRFALPLVLLLMPITAAAEDRGDALRGRVVVEEWCSMCHSVDGVETDPNRAPSFVTLAQRPGRDVAFYTQFLDEDHFPMTTYRLFESEKRDVAAFLAGLHKQADE